MYRLGPMIVWGYLFFASSTSCLAVTPVELNQQGVALLQQDLPQAAIEKFKLALQALPYNEQIKANLQVAYLASGTAALDARDYEPALEFLSAGRELAPDDIRFPLYAGYVHLLQGSFSQAEVALNRCLGMDPKNVTVHRLLGKLYYGSGRMAEALVSLEKVVELVPDDSSARSMLDKVRREYQVESEMDQDHGGHFTVSYDGADHSIVGNDILDVLEDAYVEVGTWMGSFPEIRIPVLLYTRKEFSALTGAPGWSGGVYDGKIRIPLGGVAQVSGPLRALLFHEYSHVVTRYLTRGHCPAWMHEGLAEFFGRSQFDRPLESFPSALKNSELLNFADLEETMEKLDTQEVKLAYEQSYHFVAYLVEYYGWHVIQDLLGAYRSGSSTEEAFVTALGDYTLSYSSVLRRWQETARLQW